MITLSQKVGSTTSSQLQHLASQAHSRCSQLTHLCAASSPTVSKLRLINWKKRLWTLPKRLRSARKRFRSWSKSRTQLKKSLKRSAWTSSVICKKSLQFLTMWSINQTFVKKLKTLASRFKLLKLNKSQTSLTSPEWKHWSACSKFKATWVFKPTPMKPSCSHCLTKLLLASWIG